MDLLLDVTRNEHIPMTDLDIREEVDTFLFEGHDTTSTSMTITVILLAMHPDIQVRVYLIYKPNLESPPPRGARATSRYQKKKKKL